MVIGDQRSRSRLSGLVVVPDHGGEGQDALQDPDCDPDTGAATMAFQVQLAFEVWLTDSMSCRSGLNSRAPGRSASPLRAGRNSRRPSPASTLWVPESRS